MPILMAIASILNTFTLIWLLTYITSVSLIVQFLVALVGLGVSIDYALLMIFRFRDELRHGRDVEGSVVETMTRAGRAVIVSGSTVAIGLMSMVLIPIPVIRSIGIGGLLIPLVSVIAAITFLPAMLSMLGQRINSLRVMPKRIVEGSDEETGFWWRWSHVVMRRPLLIGGIGLTIVILLLIPAVQLNASEAQAKDLAGPATEDAVVGLQRLTDAGISRGPSHRSARQVTVPQTATTIADRLVRRRESRGQLRPMVGDEVRRNSWRRSRPRTVPRHPSDRRCRTSSTMSCRSSSASSAAGRRLLSAASPLKIGTSSMRCTGSSRSCSPSSSSSLILLMRAFRSVF
jgi:hypothetical protein